MLRAEAAEPPAIHDADRRCRPFAWVRRSSARPEAQCGPMIARRLDGERVHRRNTAQLSRTQFLSHHSTRAADAEAAGRGSSDAPGRHAPRSAPRRSWPSLGRSVDAPTIRVSRSQIVCFSCSNLASVGLMGAARALRSSGCRRARFSIRSPRGGIDEARRECCTPGHGHRDGLGRGPLAGALGVPGVRRSPCRTGGHR